MGSGQSVPHLRGRDAPASVPSRLRGFQGDAKTSHSHTTLVTEVPQQSHRSIIGYTSRLMQGSIEAAFSCDFLLLRRTESGSVYRMTCRRSGRKVETLVVKKHVHDPVQLERLKKEIQTWLSLDHPNIARLLEVYEDENAAYLVSEYCPGGSLYDYVSQLHTRSEDAARTWALQMTRALGYLQSHGIVHRNLQLDSWQLTAGNPQGTLKLYGLTHATHWKKRDSRLNAACGLLAYTSPDVLLGHYTDACDLWSLGVIVYQLLCGRPPFVGPRDEVVRRILSGEVDLQPLDKSGASEDAKSFVMQLLTISPHTRLTAQGALEHPWLYGYLLKREPFPPACTAGLACFASSSALRRAALLTCAYCLNSDESDAAARWFAAAAHARCGCLTMEDLQRSLQREQEVPLLQEEIEDIFDALDINKNGEIPFTVFAAAMIESLIQAEESLLQRTFAKLDKDGDGILSLDDCRWVFGDLLCGQSLEAALEQEADEDRCIDYSRFVKMIRELPSRVTRPFHRPPMTPGETAHTAAAAAGGVLQHSGSNRKACRCSSTVRFGVSKERHTIAVSPQTLHEDDQLKRQTDAKVFAAAHST